MLLKNKITPDGIAMEKTDRQTDKTTRWQMTVYQGQWSLVETMPPGIAEWGWQTEICPKTQTPHYQGYLRTTQQQRMSWLKKLLPGIHFEVCGVRTPDKPQHECWIALKNYCQKKETRSPDSVAVHQVSQFMTLYQYTDDVAKRVAQVIKAQGQTVNEIPKAKRIEYVDTLVRQDICEGKRYAGHIATNPQWVTLWNKYSFELIFSFMNIDAPQSQDEVQPEAPRPQGQEEH